MPLLSICRQAILNIYRTEVDESTEPSLLYHVYILLAYSASQTAILSDDNGEFVSLNRAYCNTLEM
jgi:hypothetical protein